MSGTGVLTRVGGVTMPPERTERGILFVASEVRSVLEGSKTQLRRVVDESRLRVRLPALVHGDWLFAAARAEAGIHVAQMNQFGAVSVQVPSPGGRFHKEPKGEPILLGVKPLEFEWVCPFGVPGDRLWVKETWQDFCPMWDGAWCGCGSKELQAKTHSVAYRATKTPITHKGKTIHPEHWRSSTQMPRWASRLSLEVTNVRMERLQEITHEDIEAERPPGRIGGRYQCEHCNGNGHNFTWPKGCPHCDGTGDTPREYFLTCWDSINSKRGHPWESNPWVWALTFKRVKP